MPKVTSGKVTPQEFWNKCINKIVIATATIVNKVFLATEEIVIYQRWGVRRYIDSDLIHFYRKLLYYLLVNDRYR